jgi:hypothetical protein
MSNRSATADRITSLMFGGIFSRSGCADGKDCRKSVDGGHRQRRAAGFSSPRFRSRPKRPARSSKAGIDRVGGRAWKAALRLEIA